MSQQLSVASSVCSKAPYAAFLPLRNFAPAEEFCSIYQAKSQVSSTSDCPKGNVLCTLLSSLSECDSDFISTVCSCINSQPTTTISVPKTSSTPKSTTKSQSTSVKTTLSTSATNKQSSSKVASTTTTSATASCTSGVTAASPTPSGATCQQRGDKNPAVWDILNDGTATSIADCASQCLANPACNVSDYNTDTGECKLYIFNAVGEGFVADASSPDVLTDRDCFQSCGGSLASSVIAAVSSAADSAVPSVAPWSG